MMKNIYFRALGCFILFLGVGYGNTVLAQVAESPEEVRVLSPDTWALQFSVTPNFMLGSFAGSAVSLQRQYSERRALRIGVGLLADHRSRSTENESQETEISDGQTDFALQMEALFLTYQETARPIRYFGGIGPIAHTGWSRQRLETLQNGEVVSETTARQFEIGVGARTATGVKWIVHSQIGLFAEYGIALRYERQSRTNESETQAATDEQRVTTNRLHLRGDGVRLGVSVFF